MQLDEENSEAHVSTLPMKLLFVGFFLAFIGFIVLIIATGLQGNSRISGGLIIFIGPVPIILGLGPYSFFAILLAVILTIIGFIVFFLVNKISEGWPARLGFGFDLCLSCFFSAPYHIKEG